MTAAKRFTSNIYIVHSSHTNIFVGIAALTSLLNKEIQTFSVAVSLLVCFTFGSKLDK